MRPASVMAAVGSALSDASPASGRSLARPKSRILSCPLVAHHDVVGLQISMRDAVPVRGAHRVRDRNRDLKKAFQPEIFRFNEVGESLPLDELHGNEVDPVRFFDGVDGDDVRVIERRDRFGFTLESLPPLRVSRHIRRQNFDGDLPVELRVTRAVDFAHATRTERGENLVISQTMASAKSHDPSPNPSPQGGEG